MDDVLVIQDRFDRAELSGDRGTLRDLIADDVRSIGPRGFVPDKNEWIDRHDQFTYRQRARVDSGPLSCPPATVGLCFGPTHRSSVQGDLHTRFRAAASMTCTCAAS